jgi:hypothetical protein
VTARLSLYVLLVAVAAAGAVLSFAALRDLALLCGFATGLAWLLPVVVDAGAAAGTLVWLGGHGDIRAQRFARRLALTLLASSVAANALSHGLAAYGAHPAWWVVVLVSGVAPAVLGAVVHLAVLACRAQPGTLSAAAPPPVATPVAGEVAEPAPAVFVPLAAVAAANTSAQVTTLTTALPPVTGEGGDEGGETWEAKRDRLIAEGAGRKRLAKELGVNEYEARQWLAQRGGSVAAS